MTPEQVKYAARMLNRIERLKGVLEDDHPIDDLAVPDEMINRHQQEKRDYLEAELAHLQATLKTL
jgi:hypothetical protein